MDELLPARGQIVLIAEDDEQRSVRVRGVVVSADARRVVIASPDQRGLASLAPGMEVRLLAEDGLPAGTLRASPILEMRSVGSHRGIVEVGTPVPVDRPLGRRYARVEVHWAVMFAERGDADGAGKDAWILDVSGSGALVQATGELVIGRSYDMRPKQAGGAVPTLQALVVRMVAHHCYGVQFRGASTQDRQALVNAILAELQANRRQRS